MDDKLLHLEKELFPDDAEYFMQMKNWEEFQEPKMVYLGLVDKEDYAYYKEHPDKTNERRLRNPEKLVKELRAKGYLAVSIDSPEAADPSTLVVSPTGIRTPYLSPKTIKDDVEGLLKNIITSASVYPMSYPHPRGLTEEADMADCAHNYETEFKGYKHPHLQWVKMIMETYGENFRAEMIEEAYRRRQSDQYLRDLSKKPGKKLFVFSARSYGQEAHQNNRFNQDEGRMTTYGTTDFEEALRFSGIKFNSHTDKKFAFVEVFELAENQKMTREFGLESAMKPAEREEEAFETEISREENPHLMTMMVFEDGTYFEIEKNDEKWQDFQELYREDYQAYNEAIAQRRRDCFNQVMAGGLHTYDMFKSEGSVYKEKVASLELEMAKSAPLSYAFAGSIERMRAKTAQIKKEQAAAVRKEKLTAQLKENIAQLLETVIDIKRRNTHSATEQKQSTWREPPMWHNPDKQR